MLDDYGTLSVRSYTAGGAIPVSNALVRIHGAEEENRFISYSLITDEDGMTPIVELPTYSKEFSVIPNPAGKPYSIYNIEILAEGYLPKRISGIPIFSGVYSLLPVSLLPEGRNSVTENNSDITIPDNELL